MLRAHMRTKLMAFGVTLLGTCSGLALADGLVVTLPDLGALKSAITDGDVPVGVNAPVSHVADFGQWAGEDSFAGGDVRVWQSGAMEWLLPISSKGADGLRVHLTGLQLPAGASLQYLDANGDSQGTVVGAGPFADGDVWSPVLAGESAWLLVVVPEESRAELASARLTVEQVAHMGGEAIVSLGGASTKALAGCQTALPEGDSLRDALGLMVYSRGSGPELQYALSGVAVSTSTGNATVLTSAYGIRFDSQARSATLMGVGGGAQLAGGRILAQGLGTGSPDFTLLEFAGPIDTMTPVPVSRLGGSVEAGADIAAKGFHYASGAGEAISTTLTIPATSACDGQTPKVGATAPNGGTSKALIGGPVVDSGNQIVALVGPSCGETTLPANSCDRQLPILLSRTSDVLSAPTRFGGTVGEFLSGSAPCTLTVDTATLYRTGESILCKSEQTVFLTINTAPGCAWTVTENASWLTPLVTSGTGPGAVFFKVAANTAIAADGTPAPQRTATITVTPSGSTPILHEVSQHGLGTGFNTLALDSNLLGQYRRKVVTRKLDTCGPELATRIEVGADDVEVIVRMKGPDGVNADLWVGATEDVGSTRPAWLSSNGTSRETIIINSTSTPPLAPGVPLDIRPYVSRFTDLASATTDVELEILVRRLALDQAPIPVTPALLDGRLVADFGPQIVDRVLSPYRLYLLNIPTDFTIGEVTIEAYGTNNDITLFAADASRLTASLAPRTALGPDLFRGGGVGVSQGVIRIGDQDGNGGETIISNAQTNSFFITAPTGPVWIVGVLPESDTATYSIRMTATGRQTEYFTAPLAPRAPTPPTVPPAAGNRLPSYQEVITGAAFTLGADLYQWTRIEVPRFPAAFTDFQLAYTLNPFRAPRTRAVEMDVKVTTTVGENTAAITYAPYYNLPNTVPGTTGFDPAFLFPAEFSTFAGARTYALANKLYPRFRLADEYAATSPVDITVPFFVRYPVSAGDLLVSLPNNSSRDFGFVPDDLEELSRHLVLDQTLANPARRERVFRIRRDGGGQGSTILNPGTWTLGVLRNSTADTVFDVETTVRYPQVVEPLTSQVLGPFDLNQFDSHHFAITLPAGTTLLEAELVAVNGPRDFPRVNLLLNRHMPAYERTREFDAALTPVTGLRSSREKFTVTNPLASEPSITAQANGVAAELDGGTTRNPLPGDTWYVSVTSNGDVVTATQKISYTLRVAVEPGNAPLSDVITHLLGQQPDPSPARLDANLDGKIDSADVE